MEWSGVEWWSGVKEWSESCNNSFEFRGGKFGIIDV
jgi:hypothetical protein